MSESSNTDRGGGGLVAGSSAGEDQYVVCRTVEVDDKGGEEE